MIIYANLRMARSIDFEQVFSPILFDQLVLRPGIRPDPSFLAYKACNPAEGDPLRGAEAGPVGGSETLLAPLAKDPERDPYILNLVRSMVVSGNLTADQLDLLDKIL